MAKIFDPSGETEFFEITELQQAFEKELKTGEKVTVSAGVKEASILREAPIRADLAGLYQEFKDRILNPFIPIQPPVFRARCTAVLRPMRLEIAEAYTNSVAYTGSPELYFETTLDTSQGYFNVPQCNANFFSTFNGTEYEWLSNPLPFSQLANRSSASQTQIIVPDYYTLRAYTIIQPVIPNTGEIFFDGGIPPYGVTITALLGGGVSFATGAFSCANLPFGEYEIFNLKADLFVPAYGATPYPYSLSNCSYTLFNYRFTNLFP